MSWELVRTRDAWAWRPRDSRRGAQALGKRNKEKLCGMRMRNDRGFE